MNKISIIHTADGSHTLIQENMQEHYHSTFGAINESKHIFIENGLNYYFKKYPKNNYAILEIGFGTGLNALLTKIELANKQINCVYHTHETTLLNEEIYMSLNYPKILNVDPSLFYLMHQSTWDIPIMIDSLFELTKFLGKFENAFLAKNYYDIVFFDAFSPQIQPELWTENIFQKIYLSMKSNGVLTTYSTKGIVKNALKTNGFHIEKIPGPCGKREILRAFK